MVFSAGSFGPVRVRILVAERDAMLARSVAAALAAGLLNSEVEIADSLESAETRLRGARFSAMIAGTSLGADAPSRLRALMDGPLLMIGAGAMAEGVDARMNGADDFLVAPFAPQALVDRLMARLAEKPSRPAPAEPPARQIENLSGSSPAMQRVYGQIERIAPSKAPVFITGESGTGKSFAAQAVHAASQRPGPFIAVACGGRTKEAVQAEMFGSGGVPGAFERADGGTLFLDGICDLDLSLQAALLHVLQTGEVRCGSPAARRDVRLICATHRDPKGEMAAGRLRDDLFYHLHVLPLELPPLRNRGEDVLKLAANFLACISQEEGRAFTGFDPLARLLIASYAWPGNVRELEAAVRRVVVLNSGGTISADMMPDDIAAAVLQQPHDTARTEARAENRPAASAPPAILPMWMQEERIIEEALAAFGGNIGRAAAALEINPSTIYRRRQATRKTG